MVYWCRRHVGYEVGTVYLGGEHVGEHVGDEIETEMEESFQRRPCRMFAGDLGLMGQTKRDKWPSRKWNGNIVGVRTQASIV